MIQVNLIPDLKAEYLKAQRNKRFVMSISFLVTAAFVGLAIVMFLYVTVWQQRHTDRLEADIQNSIARLNNIEDLDKVVTVQNQLGSLPVVHADKPLISRLVTYLSIITPKGPVYESVDMSFDTQQVELIGKADDTDQVETLAKTIREAFYIVGEDEENQVRPFTNITLNTISTKDNETSFEINFTFDPQIFTIHDDVTLDVPEKNATNSNVQRPNVDPEVFNAPEEE